jgi:putative tryptophan/tyrosine transport system substrate-binding protein
VTTRRTLLRLLGIGALSACTWPARGQEPPKIPRVGVLWFGSKNDLLFSRWSGVFRQRLSELGYIEGKTIVVDIRYAERNTERLNALAREFVANGVDIIVAPAVAASVAAKQATSTIPIVMLHAGNPVGAGLIASLARPGGNVTGTSNILVGGKQVQLLREVVPRLARLAILVNPTNAGAPPALADAADAARSYNINLVVAEVSRLEDFPNAFAVIRNAHPDGLFIMSEPLIGGRIAQVIEFAAGLRLAVISDNGNVTHAGGLMSYGPDFPDHYVMAAEYVDKILKGAKPADLPVQQPRKFELVINMKTAKALGITIPKDMLLRADEVIQ